VQADPMKPGSSPSVGIAATARILRRAALTAVVALASGAEPRAQTPGVEPTNEKPFQPVSVFDHPGGQYHAPPDAGGPPGNDTPTSGEGKPQQTSGEVARPSSHPGGDPKMAPAAAADGSRSPAAPVTLLDLHPDSWETWWETNKFDFIELRRVDDPIRTTQGTTAESPARRELRLATVRAAVRDKVLPELRELTRSPDAGVRAASIVALGKLRDQDSIERAMEMLSDPSFQVRRSAILALGVLTTGRASWLLLHIADDSQKGRTLIGSSPVSVDDRGVALLSACLRGDQAAEQLLERLISDREDSNPQLVALAADAAGLMGSPDLIRPLVDLAFDGSVPQYVRSSAASALGRIGDPSATPALVNLLEQDNEPRRAASIALGEVGHPGATSVIERLGAILQHESDAPTRHFAAISLGRIGGPLAQQALEQALARAPDDMRPWIVLALGLCERSEATGTVAPRLIELCTHEGNSSTLGALLVALGLTRSSDGIPVLVQHLETRSNEVAGAAAMGLGLSGRREAAAPLRAALTSSSDPEVLRQAAMALGILGDVGAQKDLLELMRTTRDPYVAAFAATGVAFLGDSDAVGPLLELIRRSGPNGLTTIYAVTALGQLFDTERRPALSRLAASDNYLARTTAVDDLLSLGF
jgi:HEAT repeat protein